MRDPRQPVRSRSACTLSSDMLSNARQAAVSVAEDVIGVIGDGRWFDEERARLVHSMAIRILGVDMAMGAVCDEALAEQQIAVMAEAADIILTHVRRATGTAEIMLFQEDVYLVDERIEAVLVPAYALVMTIV